MSVRFGKNTVIPIIQDEPNEELIIPAPTDMRTPPPSIDDEVVIHDIEEEEESSNRTNNNNQRDRAEEPSSLENPVEEEGIESLDSTTVEATATSTPNDSQGEVKNQLQIYIFFRR